MLLVFMGVSWITGILMAVSWMTGISMASVILGMAVNEFPGALDLEIILGMALPVSHTISYFLNGSLRDSFRDNTPRKKYYHAYKPFGIQIEGEKDWDVGW